MDRPYLTPLKFKGFNERIRKKRFKALRFEKFEQFIHANGTVFSDTASEIEIKYCQSLDLKERKRIVKKYIKQHDENISNHHGFYK